MSDHELILQTIDTIYASVVDRDQISTVLEATNRLVGGVGATLEIIAKETHRPTHLWSVGAPTLARTPYIEQFAALNPRIPFSLQRPAGHVAWDRQVLDEREMANDPFYAEFLPHLGIRYFLAGILEQTSERMTALTVHRAPEQGHVDQQEIEIMQRLVPHFQRAHETAERLQDAGKNHAALEHTLEWLTDGIALLGADGRIVYANEAFYTFAKRGDGFRIVERTIEFFGPESRDHFNTTFSNMQMLRNHLSLNAPPADFPLARKCGMPAYTISLRPLLRGQCDHPEATIILLVHDPLSRNIAARQMLQQLFSLTEAEAHLAQALCAGMTTGAYASTRRVSLNTVYTHLRRLREKAACNSVAELIRRFSELNVPLRLK